MLCHAHRPAEVARPHRRCEPVFHAVGPPQCFVFVGESLHRHHRAEDLVLDHLVVLLEVGDHGRLEVVPVSPDRRSARDHARVRRRAIEESRDACQLVRIVHRTESVLARRRRTGGGRGRVLGERGDEFAVDLRSAHDARCRRAVLARVEQSGSRDPGGGSLDVCIVEHDDRRLAAEFEVHALERLRRRLGDFDSRADRPGDRHHRRCVVGDHLAARVSVAAHHVEDPVGQELRCNLGQQRSRCRSRVGRLQHHRVSGGDRGSELPHGHHHRVVPRSNLRAHPHRLSTDHRGHVAHVFGSGLALEHAGRACEEPNLVDHRRDLLRPGQLHRLPGVGDLGGEHFVGTSLDRVGDAVEGERTLRRCRLAPRLERRRGRAHCIVDVCGRTERSLRIDATGCGIDHVTGTPVACLDLLAVHEVVDLLHAHRFSHPSRGAGGVAADRTSDRQTTWHRCEPSASPAK